MVLLPSGEKVPRKGRMRGQGWRGNVIEACFGVVFSQESPLTPALSPEGRGNKDLLRTTVHGCAGLTGANERKKPWN
jgi:hypothetical protein